MTSLKIYRGLIVKLKPSEFTRSRYNFIQKIGPQIDGIYYVDRVDTEGLVYLDSEAGPFLQEDLVAAAPEELHQVVYLPRDIDKRSSLMLTDIDVPKLVPGDRVICTATWSLPQFAQRQGWPIFGETELVESVEQDGLYFRLKGFKDRFPAWHFKKAGHGSGP